MAYFLLGLLLATHVLCELATPANAAASHAPAPTVSSRSGRASSRDPECTQIYGKGLQVCSAVHASGKTIQGVECNEMLCKTSCCKAARVCQKSNFFSLSTQECISARLQHDMGTCCIVGESRGATMVYAGGAVGALIICSGLYFIVSMGSKKKVVKGEKPLPSDSDHEEFDKLYETKMPHMEVNQLIATDADDVFWED
ncbi:hypothetical protein X943_002968 [Babesia divergens]|uniref:Uncharacterized protein n=1 Tax=Babesia divergens TaxID=32595 RepID=A0AAD9LEG9_BABDI|nr:hypothetical protein X943_002968 [Babesia divergens]